MMNQEAPKRVNPLKYSRTRSQGRLQSRVSGELKHGSPADGYSGHPMSPFLPHGITLLWNTVRTVKLLTHGKIRQIGVKNVD